VNVFITGAAGFIGGYLARYCADRGCRVLGVDLEPGDPPPGAAFEFCDVRDAERLARLLQQFAPDRVFHLAAQSSPVVSVQQPWRTLEINTAGTINLLEAVRGIAGRPAVVIACSSGQYGTVRREDLPVREDHPFRPAHPYGISKVAQDLLAAHYFERHGVRSIRMRIFNTTGPGKIGDVCSDLTKRAIEIDAGLRPPPLPVGNLTSVRAIGDVRDLVHGLWLAAERCRPGDAYNIGATHVYSVQDVVDIIGGHLRRALLARQDPELVRDYDEPVIAGDVSKFVGCSGWVPGIDLGATIRDMLDWWAARLRAGGCGRPSGPPGKVHDNQAGE
jgi:nucleoside-diphosphate-sugar epimerase